MHFNQPDNCKIILSENSRQLGYLDEEVLLGSCYRIDALVKVGDGRKVAVEVDGPSHFIQRRPTGSTTLKLSNPILLDRSRVDDSEMTNRNLIPLLLLRYVCRIIRGPSGLDYLHFDIRSTVSTVFSFFCNLISLLDHI